MNYTEMVKTFVSRSALSGNQNVEARLYYYRTQVLNKKLNQTEIMQLKLPKYKLSGF